MNLKEPYNSLSTNEIAQFLFEKAYVDHNINNLLDNYDERETRVFLEIISGTDNKFFSGDITEIERIKMKKNHLLDFSKNYDFPLDDIPEHQFFIKGMEYVGFPSDIVLYYENVNIDNIINSLKEYSLFKIKRRIEPINRKEIRKSISKTYEKHGEKDLKKTLDGVVITLFSSKDQKETLYGLNANLPEFPSDKESGFVQETKALLKHFTSKIFHKGDIYEIQKNIKQLESTKTVLNKKSKGEKVDFKSMEVLLTRSNTITDHQKELGFSSKYFQNIIRKCSFKLSVKSTVNENTEKAKLSRKKNIK